MSYAQVYLSGHDGLGAGADLMFMSVHITCVYMCGATKCMLCTFVGCISGCAWNQPEGSSLLGPLEWWCGESGPSLCLPSELPTLMMAEAVLFSEAPSQNTRAELRNLGAPRGNSVSKANTLHVNRPLSPGVLTSPSPSAISQG